MKTIITTESIKTGGDKRSVIAIFSLFAVVGIASTVAALLSALRDPNTNNLITLAVVTGLIGVPFGCFIGIKNVVYSLRRNSMIKNGDIIIYIDEVVDKTRLGNTSDPNEDKEYQLTTKQYSAKTGKNVLLPSLREFKSVKNGDSCILCFTRLSKRPFRVFPCSLYVLSEELEEKVTKDIDDAIARV